MFFVAALVICLIIKFHFSKGKSIGRNIEERYGIPALLLSRRCEYVDLKLKKISSDIEFLQICAENNLTPKFLNCKPYRHDIRTTKH